jgi:prenyltransferase beta subunit
VLWQTDDVLTVRVGAELVKVYELYGEAHAFIAAEDQIRYHRETTFVNPSLEKLQGAFRDRMVEALLCDPETRNLHDRTLALQILGDAPRNSEAWAEIIKADLQKKCDRLPGPGNSALDFLRTLAQSLEALDALGALGASLSETKKSRLRGYVLQLRNPDGGWTREIELKSDPNGEVKLPTGTYQAALCVESHVEPTYWAVATLNALSVDLEERTRTIEFLQGRQFPDGGFNEGRSSTPRAFLSSTFHAVEALHMLGAKPKHAEDCVSWLQDHQELNPLFRVFGRPYGGFASGEHEPAWSALARMEKPSLWCTIEAVKALSTLGSRPRRVCPCIRYVLKQRTRFGFGRGWSFDTLSALSVLESLDSVGEIDRLP